MNREVHVRIWERPEVRILRATRPRVVSGGGYQASDFDR